jgi:peptide/nickel transport system substrate-binding protein
MVRLDVRVLRALILGLAAALLLAACGPGTSGSPAASGASPGASAGGSAAAGQPGGTIYILTQAEQIDQIDPQRVYTGEDIAFFASTMYRSLVTYKESSDRAEGLSLVPDLATDLGTPNADATQWKFTLKDGPKWQDGSPVTCEDVKYGVSRTYATDVINQGPTYAIAYLDIPYEADDPTASQYKGPYTGVGQDLFDKAVTCDGQTITFNLNKAVPDFAFTTTLGFFPMPKAADTGETYGTVAPFAVSNGPYKVQDYTTGNGGKLILVRNENWDPATDSVRKAYPDKWEWDFGIDPKVIDQRLIASTGNDQFAIGYGGIQPENLATIFTDEHTANPDFAGRAFSDYDVYARYYWVDVNKVPNVKIRQAMAVALDRAAIRLNIGGAFAGDFADGVIKPNIGQDYAATGLWESLLGEAVPDNGDPEFAKQLIKDSGEAAPALTVDFADTPTNGKTAAIIIDSLGKAGITVTPNPIEPGKYYSVVFDPTSAHEFGFGGWGADWPNASTVIPPLFTQKGGWDLSKLDDADFNAKVEEAQVELDRDKQSTLWQALNKEAAQNVFVIPTFFGLAQDLAGTKVAPLYRWSAYGSWPYGELYVTP